MYCGSTDYGRGCRYGPHGVHLHSDTPGKCVYCGSPNFGRGCKVNPTDEIHIHGINYNTMFRENLQSFLDNEIFLKELKKDFVDFQCYKLGIIDENGNKIKTPITEEQKHSFSPMIKTIIRLKKYLGSKIELMEIQNLAENQVNMKTDLIRYEKLLDYKDRVEDIVNDLYRVLEEAQQDGLKIEEIKKLIQA
jgi:hypothetical protein